MAFATLGKAALFVVLLVLPGYLTRLAWHRHGPGEVAQEALSFWGEVLLLGLIWTGGWGVLLAQAGWLNLAHLWVISGLYCAGLGAWLWRNGVRLRVALYAERRQVGAFAALVLAAGVLFCWPHEFILGGADAGVYVNLGANMARTGAWRIREPLIAELPPALYPALFREQPAPMIPRYVPLPGTYLTDPAQGEITPQFYPLFPVWIALLHQVGGLRLSLYATPLFGLLGCVMVYLAGRAIYGQRAGLLGAALLACTAPQIWFSRYPTSEALTQALLFGGLYALARHLESGEDSHWWGVLAGLAFGQALVSRIDLYLLCLLPIGYALYLRYRRQPIRRVWAFSAPLALLCAYSLLFAYLDSWPYFYNVYGSFVDLERPLSWLPYVGAGLVAAPLAWLLAGWLGSLPDRARLAEASRLALRVAAVAVVLLAVYAYFVRPLLAPVGESHYYWYGDHQVPYVEPYNLVRLGWYLTPLGLLAATGGVFLALWRGIDRRAAPLLALGLIFTVFFLYNSRNNPHHIYVMRRYVPVVIPFLMLMAGHGLACLGTLVPRHGQRIAGALTLCLVVWLLASAAGVIRHVDYQGLIAQFEAWTTALGDDPTVYLFNDLRPVGPGASIGTPLRYLEGATVFDLQEERLDPTLLQAQIARWQRAGYRVIMVEGEQAAPLFADEPARSDAQYVEFRFPMLETSYEHKPRQIWSVTIPLRYWVIPRAGSAPEASTALAGGACT